MLREVFEFALWLSVSSLIVTISLIEAVFGKKARILSWILETFILPVMAAFVSTSTMDRIKSIFKQPIQGGEHPGKLYSIPVYQRKDGTTLRIGHLVERTSPKSKMGDEASDQEDMVLYQKVHVINDILLTADMTNVTLSLNPVEGVNVIHSEEMLCDVDEVESLPGKKVAATLAKKGIATVIRDIPAYPHHIQRTIRKHMLAASLRREVQKFLAGFSMAKTLSLGTLDWRLDPGILGLERSTDFSLDYHVEKFTTTVSHLDVLMGQGWDVRTISGTDGYRVVLTLELWVDLNFDIKVQIHGCLCSGALDLASYRSTCLKVYTSPESRAAVSRLVSARSVTSVNNTRMTQDGSKAGISMAWDEFQPPSADTSPNRLPGIPSATTSLEDLIAGLGDHGASTAMEGLDAALAQASSSTALGCLDEALARVPFRKNDLMFESPIKEESINISSADGPNTSTPAECLDNSKEECEIFQATGSPVNSLKIELSNASHSHCQPDGRETPRTLSPDQITAITVADSDQLTPRHHQQTGISDMGSSKPDVGLNMGSSEPDQDMGSSKPDQDIGSSEPEVKKYVGSLKVKTDQNSYNDSETFPKQYTGTGETPETEVQQSQVSKDDEVDTSAYKNKLETSQNIPINEAMELEREVTNSIHNHKETTVALKEEPELVTNHTDETNSKQSNEPHLQSSEILEAANLEPCQVPENLPSNIVPEKTSESAIKTTEQLDDTEAIKTEQLDDKEKNVNKLVNDETNTKEETKSNEDNEEFIENNPDNNKEKVEAFKLPETPAKGTSRVQDYLKSLPPTSEINTSLDKIVMAETAAFDNNSKTKDTISPSNPNDGSKNDSNTSTDDSNDNNDVSSDEVNLSMDTMDTPMKDNLNLSMDTLDTPMKDNVSLNGSQASSRMTGLSSQISSRIGSGLFYGMVGQSQSTQPTCPFPEEWQHGVIPESIENDDDLD